MSREFLDFLTEYDWPGNVRELQNLIERLVILSSGDVLRVEDLPEYLLTRETPVVTRRPATPEHAPDSSTLSRDPEPPTVHKPLHELERDQVEAALKRHGWVQARAARELGLTQRQIGYRIKKYNLKRPEYY